jgi:hypothetical protein
MAAARELVLPGTLGLTRAGEREQGSTAQAAYRARVPVIWIWWLDSMQHP